MEDVIKAERLSKSYNGQFAVESVNISVKRGTVFGLLGANGAGKSTTIECILGTKIPDSGTVTIFGMNPTTARKRLFEKVGVQFQEANYQEKITVGELCEVTQSFYKEATDYLSLLKRFGIADKITSPVKGKRPINTRFQKKSPAPKGWRIIYGNRAATLLPMATTAAAVLPSAAHRVSAALAAKTTNTQRHPNHSALPFRSC